MNSKVLIILLALISYPAFAVAKAHKAECEVSLSTNIIDARTGNPRQDFNYKNVTLTLNSNGQDALREVRFGKDHSVKLRVVQNPQEGYYTLMTYIQNNNTSTSDFYAAAMGKKKPKQDLDLNVSTLNIKALNFGEMYGPFNSEEELLAAQKMADEKMLFKSGEWANAAIVCKIK